MFNIEYRETLEGTYSIVYVHCIKQTYLKISKSMILALISNEDNISESLKLLEDKLSTYNIIDNDYIIEFFNIEETKEFCEWINSRIIIKRLKI